MDPPNVRVLTRPPASSPSSDLPPPPSSTSSSAGISPPSLNGVVVVGFISQKADTSSQLINRVVDANVFGSGRANVTLDVNKDEFKAWFESRRISYYHEEEKGILFLQFCSTRCPVFHGSFDMGSSFDSVMDEHDFGDLQGLLFMFSVCHAIIYIQEGSHFNTQLLKKFRVLQSAKHALTPYVKTRSTPPLPSKTHSSSPSRPSVVTSNKSSPGKNGGNVGRNSSSISLMSGLGSYASLFPGQCTPVTLFVFVEDFSDVQNPSSSSEDSTDVGLTNAARPMKGSGSVVVLARPANKSEGGFKKKFQSSLEAQIRFMIKKCRTLSGSENNHSGSRGAGVLNSSPLFSLDASRAVVLLDSSTTRSGESLEFAMNLVEDILKGEATSDSLLLESLDQSGNKDDFLSIKEFIYRQSDILRGRGGLVTNTNNGVGMVAVAAAAAAAASAASGKAFNTPQLPSLEIWLSSSRLILQGLLSAKPGSVSENEFVKRKPRQKSSIVPQVEGNVSKHLDPLDIAVSLLGSSGGVNKKFSTQWCQKMFPVAKDVYLKDLPPCYPTSQHEAHLKKALNALHSMVRGPAVPLFAKMLENECKSIWECGRQLCDAISLTGKPCMYQRHNVTNDVMVLGNAFKPHSSGYVFLHACACGRSRRLRADPFDFDSANDIYSRFLDCDKLLAKIELPEESNVGPVKPSSWSLIRVGGAKYYEASKGLLQSGFPSNQKFLMKWTILLDKQKNLKEGSVTRSSNEPKVQVLGNIETKKGMNGNKNQTKSSTHDDNSKNKISFGKGLPNFMMRKPFSEVVAGPASTDSGFPPLQQRKQHSSKGIKENRQKDRSVDHRSQKSGDNSSLQEIANEISLNGHIGGDPFLRIGSNVIPVNVNGGEKVKSEDSSLKQVITYVGFEHECPHGHRFLLNPEHIGEPGSSYSLLEGSHTPSSQEASDSHLANSSKSGENGSNAASALNKVRNMGKLKEKARNGNLYKDGDTEISRHQANLPNSVKDLEAGFQSVSLSDGGCAFSMLNRNLPIYMNCPHCRVAKNYKNSPNVKFAGTVSQLQRIFLVTPPFPVVLATRPVVQFEASCLPPSIPNREQKLQFGLGCRVILPPESFLALRLPFIYGVQLENESVHSLKPFENKPEATAWLTKGTTLQVMSKGSSFL